MKTISLIFFSALLALSTSTATAFTTVKSYSAINSTSFKVAAVRQLPVNFAQPVGLNKTWVDLDLNQTIAQAVVTINEAKEDGVALIAFPELYFPGYPIAVNTAYTAAQLAQYVGQSMSVNGTEFATLVQAFKTAGIYGSFGFSEISGDAIYMAQALIGPDGSVLQVRRKLRPSGTERDIWSDGDPSGLRVIGTPHGRIGMLECWEHFHPTMTFPMLSQSENIHIAAFPYAYDEGKDPVAWESFDVSAAAARTYATNSGALTLMPSIGTAAIFAAGGAMLNMTNASENPSWKYITTTIDTTGFSLNTTYDADGEQSWGALQYMLETFPTYIPKVNDTLFDEVVNPIQNITDGIVT